MSCEYCVAGCPNCWPPEEECEACDGYGKFFFVNRDINDPHEYVPCDYEEYKNTPDDRRMYNICEECDGTGLICTV